MSLQLSYVVVTDCFDTIRDVVHAVRASSIADRVELVIVCPSETELAMPARETTGIGAVRIVPIGPVIPLSRSRAAGIRAASCELVFIGETHSYPAPTCLESLVAAHRSGDFVAITPIIENGNPKKALSWAALMLTYRHWIAPADRGPIDVLSTYNACFRRAALVAFGDRLEAMQDYGSGLDTALLAGGGTFLIEPAARLAHLNVAALTGWLPERFLSGRFWGTARSRHWSLGRRATYVLASPLLPFMIASKALRSKQWAHHRRETPAGTLIALIACAVATAAGEATAYLAGGGQTAVSLAEYELHRARYL